MQMNFTNIGDTLRLLREAKGIKQGALQQALVNACNLSKIEANKASISLPVFFEILDLLDVSLEEFKNIHLKTQTNQYIKMQKHFDYYYPRISINQVSDYRTKLQHYQKYNFEDVAHRKQKLLFHKISCFYYLNFMKNPKKGSAHAKILLHYYKNIINVPLLHDFELIPIIIPFLSLKEAETLIEDITFFKKKNHYNYKQLDEIYIRTYLNLAKKAVEVADELYLATAVEKLTFFLSNNPSLLFYSEFLILKGILFYDYQNQKDVGKMLVHSGLRIAKQHRFTNLYDNWYHFCQYMFNEKN